MRVDVHCGALTHSVDCHIRYIYMYSPVPTLLPRKRGFSPVFLGRSLSMRLYMYSMVVDS